MKVLSEQEIEAVRQGAVLQNYKPYIDNDLDRMKKAVLSSVMILTSRGELTPDLALAKWYEYIALERVGQGINKKINVGVDFGKHMPKELTE